MLAPLRATLAAADLGWRYWASEDYSTVADWAGAGCWGRLLNENFVRMNMTSTVAWSAVWGVYDGLICANNSLMYAPQPWSASYTVNGPIWATAHTTQVRVRRSDMRYRMHDRQFLLSSPASSFPQFVKPGWRYLSVPGGGSGNLTANGPAANATGT